MKVAWKLASHAKTGVDLHLVDVLASPSKARRVQILQDHDDLVSPGLQGQATWYPACVCTQVRIPVVPQGLDAIGLQLSLVGQVGSPAVGMLSARQASARA